MLHYHWKNKETPPRTTMISLYPSTELTNVACYLPLRYVQNGGWIGDNTDPDIGYCIATFEAAGTAPKE